MVYAVKRSLIILATFSNVFTPANGQIAMPMYMQAPVPQPVYAVPAPVPIAVPIQLPERKTTTTTTTTTESPNYAIAMPVPVPMPVQFAVPAQPPPVYCQNKPKLKACPPCPPCVCLPSCTPAFFSYCSPCHQKCRCRNSEDAPVPLPLNPPVPAPRPIYPISLVPAPVGPPPVVIVPLPPVMRRPAEISTSDSDSSDTCDSSSDRYYLKRGRKLRRTMKTRKRKYRRNAGGESEENTGLVKPVLSYISENGDVKFETKLSNKDALKILSAGKKKTSNEQRTVDIETDDGSEVVTSGRRQSEGKYNKVMLRNIPTNHELKKVQEVVTSPNKETNGAANNTCCMGMDCYYPCPYPVVSMYPVLPPQFPVVLPARTVYEPVVHDHPPLRKIVELIKADKIRNRFSSSTSDEVYSNIGSSESNPNIDYYSD